jgi:hypothetical protein
MYNYGRPIPHGFPLKRFFQLKASHSQLTIPLTEVRIAYPHAIPSECPLLALPCGLSKYQPELSETRVALSLRTQLM